MVANKKKEASLYKYSTISSYYGKEKYYEKFFKRLHSCLTRFYGSSRTRTILSLMSRRLIKIINPETFFSIYQLNYDPSTKAFNSSTSLNEFFSETLLNYRKLQEEGCSTIPITWFFVQLSIILSKSATASKEKKERMSYVQVMMDGFVSALATINNKSPFVIRLLSKEALRKVYEATGETKVPYAYYMSIILSFFNSYNMLSKKWIKKPKVELIIPMENDVKFNQTKYLMHVFNLKETLMTKTMSNVTDISEETEENTATLEYLRSNSKYKFIDIKDVYKELKRIKTKCKYKTQYTPYYGYHYALCSFPRTTFNNSNITYRYVLLDDIKHFMSPSLGEIEVNCDKLSKDDIKVCVEAAAELCLTSYRFLKEISPSSKRGEMKIILKNLHPLNDEYINEILSIKRNVESLHNNNFGVIMEFKKEVCETKYGDNYPTHIRIISDLHVDINENKYEFDFGDDFIVNCGDTSGDAVCSMNWIRSNIRKGVFTSGNHLGYNQPFPELNGEKNLPLYNSLIHEANTLNGQSSYLAGEFANGDIKYLNNTCYEYNGIIFIGATLYTNYELFGKERRDECIAYAKVRMNDFKYPKAYADFEPEAEPKRGDCFQNFKNKRIVTPNPILHIKYHKDTMRFLTEKVREYKGKPIVILTHHAPFVYSVSKQYKNDPLSAAFASDLTYFLKKFPEIRLWVHGHVHNNNDYIYGNTRVISCPFGYYNENNVNPSNYGERISMKDIKSNKPWKQLLHDEIVKGKIKVYNLDN